MAIVLAEDFEGASSGTTATTGNTAFTQGVIGAPVFTSAQSVTGAQAMHFATTGTAANLGVNLTSGSSKSVRLYVNVATLPAARAFVAAFSATTTTRCQLGIDPAGTVAIRNATTLVATTAAAIATGSWYRIEWKVDSGTSTQTVSLFALHSTTPLDSVSGTYNQGAIDRLLMGVVASATVSFDMDTVAVDDTATDIGPQVTAVPTWTYTYDVRVGG